MPTTSKIRGPSRDVTAHLYADECKFALEASFQSLMKKAVAAGWKPRVAAYSLMILAAEKLRKLSPDEDAGYPDE